MALSDYLSLQDLRSLCQTNARLRREFEAQTWSHVTVLPDNYAARHTRYRHSETRAVSVDMLLFPHRFRTWAAPELVHTVVILWDALADVCLKTARKGDLAGVAARSFPALRHLRLADRAYDNELEPHAFDPISSLGTGNVIPGVETIDSMVAFGDVGWPELFALFDCAKATHFALSSVLCVYALGSYDTVASLSFNISTVTQSECLHLCVADARFRQCVRRMKNLVRFELRETVPDVADPLQLDGLLGALGVLPRLRHVVVEQARFTPATVRTMKLLRGDYNTCELVLGDPVHTADDDDDFPELALPQVTRIDFDAVSGHTYQSVLLKKLHLPKVRTVRGLSVDLAAPQPEHVFDSVTSLEVELLHARKIATGDCWAALFERFPNITRLYCTTDFDLYRSFDSLGFHSEMYSLCAIFRIFSDMFLESVGADYFELLDEAPEAGPRLQARRTDLCTRFVATLVGNAAIPQSPILRLVAELFALAAVDPDAVAAAGFSVREHARRMLELEDEEAASMFVEAPGGPGRQSDGDDDEDSYGRLARLLRFLARPPRPLFFRNLEFVCVSFALAGAQQARVLRACPALQYLEFGCDGFGLVHPFLGHLLRRHGALRQVLFPTTSVHSPAQRPTTPGRKRRRRESSPTQQQQQRPVAELCTEIVAVRGAAGELPTYRFVCVADADGLRRGYAAAAAPLPPQLSAVRRMHGARSRLHDDDVRVEFDASRQTRGRLVWPYVLGFVPEPSFEEAADEAARRQRGGATVQCSVVPEDDGFVKYEQHLESWMNDDNFSGWI